MREIKFRAWDNKMKYFLSPENYLLTLDGKLFLPEIETGYDIDPTLWNGLTKVSKTDKFGYISERNGYEHDRFILMQYTGLKEKYGREIYEGDIVKFIDDVTLPEKPSELITEVIWWQEMAQWTLKYTYKELNFMICDEIEIIGNIYENPEMIKQ